MNTDDATNRALPLRRGASGANTAEADAARSIETSDSRLKSFLLSPYLTLVSRLILGGIFLLSGLTKLGAAGPFADNIDEYQMPLPFDFVTLMSQWLPVLELALGIWLILGLFTRISAWISGGLMLVFLIAMVQAWIRGLKVNCGCFAGDAGNPLGLALIKALGPVGTFLANEKVGWESVTRDLLFLFMAFHLIKVPTVFGIDNLRARYSGRGEYAPSDMDEFEMAEAEAQVED